MITEFKLFENSEDSVTLVLNDIVDYFDGADDSIRNFIFKLLPYNNNIIEFDCKRCTKMINGATNYFHMNKHHKGILNGMSYGFNYDTKKIHLSLDLRRIKYHHELNTDSPMTIYGYIPDEVKKVVNIVNIKRQTNKFNL